MLIRIATRIHQESANAIQEPLDHVHEHLRVLQSMKLPTESWGELIIDRDKFGRQLEATLGRTYRANGSRNDKYYDEVFAATVSSVRADVFKRK